VRLVAQPVDEIGKWVVARSGLVKWTDDMPAFAIVSDDDTTVLGGATFTDYTGTSIAVHIAIVNPLITRTLIRAIGRYAFEQLRCKRLTLAAESTNLAALDLHKRLGAVHEGTLVGASRSGDDILLSRFEPSCEFWRKVNGRSADRE
jgi:RimJ/RimL family protein N-acetyltransferase